MIGLIWMLFGIGAAIAASNKKRSVFGWFLLGILLGPFGLLFILLLPVLKDTVNSAIVRPDYHEFTKICPMCAEEVKLAALKCKHCGETFDPDQVVQAEALLADPTYCPRCHQHDVTNAFLGDGSFGPFCPNCKTPVK